MNMCFLDNHLVFLRPLVDWMIGLDWNSISSCLKLNISSAPSPPSGYFKRFSAPCMNSVAPIMSSVSVFQNHTYYTNVVVGRFSYYLKCAKTATIFGLYVIIFNCWGMCNVSIVHMVFLFTFVWGFSRDQGKV